MFQLVLAVLAIGLVAATLSTTVSYVNPAAVQAETLADRLTEDFQDLKTGYETYMQSHATPPNALADITPAYVFRPPAPGPTHWSFGAGPSGGRYFCLSGTFSAVGVRAIRSLRVVFSPQAYFINTTCGATTDALPATGSAFTGAVTLWVAPY